MILEQQHFFAAATSYIKVLILERPLIAEEEVPKKTVRILSARGLYPDGFHFAVQCGYGEANGKVERAVSQIDEYALIARRVTGIR
ncbi:hypothetical protein D3C81_1684810 [compost metagenome]